MALPILLARMMTILKDFVVEQSLSISETGERALISDVMCVLEVRRAIPLIHNLQGLCDHHPEGVPQGDQQFAQVLATMTLSPLVVDAVMDRYKSVAPLLMHVRQRSIAAQSRRERAHLLILHPLVIECVCAREQRVRDMLRDVLRLTAAELGVGNAVTDESL